MHRRRIDKRSSKKALTAGKYQLTVTATPAAGTALVRTVKLTVKK